jgi:hypothetical protein
MLKEQIKLREADAKRLEEQVASFLAAGGAIAVLPATTVTEKAEQDFMEVLKCRQLKTTKARIKALRNCGLSDTKIIKKLGLSISTERFKTLWG